jgi:hypothetical protein
MAGGLTAVNVEDLAGDEGSSLEPDSGAAADENDGLTEKLGPAVGVTVAASAVMTSSQPAELAICASIGLLGGGMSMISMRRAVSAAS